MNKRNLNNSSFIQMILDALTCAKEFNLDAAVVLLTDLEKLAKSHKTWQEKTDLLFMKHKYPNSKIKYGKVDLTCDIERDLSCEAYKLFGIAYKHMDQTNNVELKQSVLRSTYGYSNRALINALKELVNKEFVTKIMNRNKEHGNIYHVNEKYVTKGKNNPTGIEQSISYEKNTLLSEIVGRDKESKVSYHTIHETDKNGNSLYVIYGSIDV